MAITDDYGYIQVFLDDCADMYVSLSKNTSMTGQQIVIGKFFYYHLWR